MKKKVVSIYVTTGTYDEIVSQITQLGKSKVSSYVCVANVHMLVEAYRDKTFASIVNSADVTTPDGMPLVFGLNTLFGVNQTRVAGMDLIESVFFHAQNNNIPIYLYGSTDQILEKIKIKCKNNYPGLKISGMFSPPFRPLSKQEEDDIIRMINKTNPGLIFVALGCPKQEQWMASMKGRLRATMIGVGGAFPVFAETQSRAPLFMQKSGLEWLYRLYQEPRRLWKRYLYTNILFLLLFAREWIRVKVFSEQRFE
jgi:N-acetylglucosaminyldiphosphoundecaprenol N-acetyl-beta-D-mannosaminyltransferase